MRDLMVLAAAGMSVFLAGIGAGIGARADEAGKYRVSGPFTHDNLSVYFVHGASAAGPAPLTLGEGMTQGKIKVHETGNVNSLAIENASDEEVFIQAGDIVKGGQQDRVLAVSMVLKPKSGKIDIASFCVEQGRWAKRGAEDVKQFASSTEALPSKAAKLAMAASVGTTNSADRQMRTTTLTGRGPLPQDASELLRARMETSTRQQMMWAEVEKTQQKLAAKVGAPVNAQASASSLQLSLENEKVQKTRAAYVTALAGKPTDADVIGYVVAINGKIQTGDVYASHALFKKMWGKQLAAVATEAASEMSGSSASPPAIGDVESFLMKASAAPLKDVKPSPAVNQAVAETDALVYVEARRASGGWINRSFIAK